MQHNSNKVAGDLRACIRNLKVSFGGRSILSGVTCDLHVGEIVHLVGENGAGKSLFLNALSGWVMPREGKVLLHLNGPSALDPSRISPDELARNGLGRLWQDVRIHGTLTVFENLMIATPELPSNNPFLALIPLARLKTKEKEARDRAMHNLERFGLHDRANCLGGALSVGEMKRVALARLLQMNSKLLLLDEPLAGLDAAGADALIKDFKVLTGEGRSLLIVEHREELLSAIPGKVWLLQDGQIKTDKV